MHRALTKSVTNTLASTLGRTALPSNTILEQLVSFLQTEAVAHRRRLSQRWE